MCLAGQSSARVTAGPAPMVTDIALSRKPDERPAEPIRLEQARGLAAGLPAAVLVPMKKGSAKLLEGQRRNDDQG